MRIMGLLTIFQIHGYVEHIYNALHQLARGAIVWYLDRHFQFE